MQHNITQPGGSTSVDEISTSAAATISRRAITVAVQWRADVMGSLYPTAPCLNFSAWFMKNVSNVWTQKNIMK